ncbi:uncharacterized protein LOC118814437 isoform X4 [Colossoma macropomum]|uniref:uncharacterized protein LOC118814437 isoform X4 n=1 Tax=Colossoma macropomum TaxID=42526 RepID=UPI001864BFC1|nr:uncharacterized protein LOC118814437 isoform X4 [Colossoma macropomum]
MERTAAVAVALMLLLQNSLQDPEVSAKSQDCPDELKQLKDLVYQQATALAELKVKMSYMEKESTALEARLAGREKEMENLKKENEAVKSDLEKLKNEIAGTFTAPVRGVYYIRFTAAAYNSNSNNMGLNLYKNDHHLMHLGEYNSDGKARHVSGGLALELEAGDVLYARLPADYMLYDDSLVRNSFSGFLIFPV